MDLVRGCDPHRCESFRQVWRKSTHTVDTRCAILEDFLKFFCLIRPIHQPQRPALGQLPRQVLRITTRVSLIDESEICLEAHQHIFVRTQQCLFFFENRLERSPPPRQLQFGGHRIALDVTGSKVFHQRPQMHLLEMVLDLSTVLQALQYFGFLGELFEQIQHLERGQIGQALTLAGSAQYPVELVQVLLNLGHEDVNISQARGDARLVAGVDVAIPQLALGLNFHERLVEIRYRNPWSDVLFGETFQALALNSRHGLGQLFRTGRGDEVFE